MLKQIDGNLAEANRRLKEFIIYASNPPIPEPEVYVLRTKMTQFIVDQSSNNSRTILSLHSNNLWEREQNQDQTFKILLMVVEVNSFSILVFECRNAHTFFSHKLLEETRRLRRRN